jgi:eukaryotic-like serine/threonine-protein kinase
LAAQVRPASAPPVHAGSPGPRPASPRIGAPRGPATDPFIGTVLNNRFRVEAKLGEGGFGAVYRGTQTATGRRVAIKLLHPEMTRDENLVARFKREGLVLCNLRDAHTITTYDFDQTPEGTLYIAMELLEGRSLHQVFHDEAPIGWQRVGTVLTMMCSSLAEAHAQGIVHRDLKPENIFLEKRPNHPEFVKILDFGIAKVMRGEGSVDPKAPQLTATGQTLGTLEYMSPEQLMGKQLDGRSDIYALGVLAYELMTGRLPFPDAKGPAGLITAQLKQTPKQPSEVNPGGGIPPGMDRILLRCLEKDKNNRFPDVNALARALQDCLHTGGHWGQDTPTPAPRPKPMAETRRGDSRGAGAPGLPMAGAPLTPTPGMVAPYQAPPQAHAPVPAASVPAAPFGPGAPTPLTPPAAVDPEVPSTEVALRAAKGSRLWLVVVIATVVVGGAIAAAVTLL